MDFEISLQVNAVAAVMADPAASYLAEVGLDLRPGRLDGRNVGRRGGCRTKTMGGVR